MTSPSITWLCDEPEQLDWVSRVCWFSFTTQPNANSSYPNRNSEFDGGFLSVHNTFSSGYNRKTLFCVTVDSKTRLTYCCRQRSIFSTTFSLRVFHVNRRSSFSSRTFSFLTNKKRPLPLYPPPTERASKRKPQVFSSFCRYWVRKRERDFYFKRSFGWLVGFAYVVTLKPFVTSKSDVGQRHPVSFPFIASSCLSRSSSLISRFLFAFFFW